MGAVDLLGVEPYIALEGLLAGEQVVLGVVLAHGDAQSGGGAELHGFGDHTLLPALGLGGTAEIAGVGELLPDLLKVLLALCQGNGVQHAVQIVQFPAALFQLLSEHYLSCLGLVVLLVVLGGVLLGGEKGVQGDVDLSALRVVEVHRAQPGHAPLHLIEVRGQDVPQLAQALPVMGGSQLLFLVGDLAGCAVPCGGHRADQILSPLLDPLQVLPFLIKAVQQGGEGGEGGALHPALILLHREEGEVGGGPVPGEEAGGEGARADSVQQALQPVQKPFTALGTQDIEPYIHGSSGLEGQFPADQGGQAAEGVQQPLVGLCLLRRGGQQGLEGGAVLGHGVQLGLGRREAVEHPGEEGPLGASRPQAGLHPADAVQDPPLLVQQDQVGAASDGLQHQPALHPVAQLVQRLQGQGDHALQRGLGHRQDACAGQVLAQEHTKHGGRIRIFPGQLGQLGPGVAGIGGEQQPHISVGRGAQGQDHLVPAGLIDLVDFPAGDRLVQLMDQSGQAECI